MATSTPSKRNAVVIADTVTVSGNVSATDLTLSGNLTVTGTTTTLNTATLQVQDKNIVLNYGSGDTSGSANGAGITIQDAVNSSTNATMNWNTSTDRFDFSHHITVPSGNSTNWNTAYGWGNHATAGYNNASNLSSGTLPSARLSGTYSGALNFSSSSLELKGHMYFSEHSAGRHYIHFKTNSSTNRVDWRIQTNNANNTVHSWTESLATFRTPITSTGIVSGTAFVGGLYAGATGSPDARIWAISADYSNYGIFYNEGNPDKIEFKWNNVVKAYLNMENGLFDSDTGFSVGGSTVWHAGNDGSSSGLDADTVDGKHASDIVLDNGTTRIGNMNTLGNQSAKYSWNNSTTGRPAGSQANEYGVLLSLNYDNGYAFQQAWDIDQSNLYLRTLNYSTDSGTWNKVWHAGNDGSGSGLDADTVDGVQASQIIYGNSSTGTSEGTFTNWNSINKSGFYSDDGASNKWSTSNWSSVLHHRLYSSNNNYATQLGFDTYNNNLYTRTNNNGTWTSWDKIWHAGNDGSGSGLDADTLDGINSASFLRSDTDDTASGNLTFTGNITQTGGTFLSHGAQISNLTTAWQAAGTGKDRGLYPFRFQNGATGQPETGDNAHWGLNIYAHAGSSGSYPYGTQLSAGSTQNLWHRWWANGSHQSWRKIWDTANDGSGSGLDADLLDGQHGSYYRNASNINAGTLPEARIPTISKYLRSDTADTASGKITLSQPITRDAHNVGHLEGSYNNVGANSTQSNPIYTIGSSYNPAATTLGTMYGIGFSKNTASFMTGDLDVGNNSGWGLYVAADGDARVFLNGSHGIISSTGQHYANGSLVWNAGNDGAGSGLDADLLDGQQGSYYYPNSNPSAFLTNTSSEHITYVYRIHSSDSTSPDSFGYNNRYQTFNYGVSSGITGPLISFGGLGSNYPMQLTGAYGGAGTGIKYRTRNGDTASWNSWYTLWHSGNDGASSGLDADLLDGQHGSYYLNYNNFSNTPSIPSVGNGTMTISAGTSLSGGGSFTANQSGNSTVTINVAEPANTDANWRDVVAWNGQLVKDTAVELHGSGYLRASYLNMTHGVGTRSSDTVFYSSTDDYIRKTNAAGMRASLSLYTTSEVDALIPTIPSNNVVEGGTSYSGEYPMVARTSANTIYSHNGIKFNGAQEKLTVGGSVVINGSTSWHAGNDGSGSGLDADLLDGINSSSFLRSDAADSATQRIVFSANASHNYDTIATATGSQGSIEVFNTGAGNDAFMAFHAGADYACYFGLDADSNDLAVGGWSMGANKYKVWHAGNDGSSSGLDADTVDGLHESSFMRKSANSSLDMNGYHIYDVDRVETQDENKDVKFSVWSGTTYGIGMTSSVTLGHLSDYAMTFCMNNDSDRGFWWGYSGQGKGSGAMSLTTGGKLWVTSDISTPYTELNNYTSGNIAVGKLTLKGGGKTGWGPGDEHGSIDFYNSDGSGVGARNAARIVAENNSGNGSSTTTFEGEIAFYTSAYNAQLNSDPALRLEGDNIARFYNDIRVPNGTAPSPSYTFAADTDSGMFSLGSNAIAFATGGTQRFKVNSNGLLLTGSSSLYVNGQETITSSRNIQNVVNITNTDGYIEYKRTGAAPAIFNRLGTGGNGGTSRGEIVNFKSASTKVGRIGYNLPYGSNFYITQGETSGHGLGLYQFSTTFQVNPVNIDGTSKDNAVDLGALAARFDDVYATNGTIQTSDRNEKQDIQALTTAETAAATACKGLIRRFRWISSVEEKGDDARYHFGAIAQDVEAAFTAQGLDAGDYGLFIRSTWWEHEGHSYPSATAAPTGAVEKTRLGIRYNQLLAFIISAL